MLRVSVIKDGELCLTAIPNDLPLWRKDRKEMVILVPERYSEVVRAVDVLRTPLASGVVALLHGKVTREIQPVLEHTVERLGVERYTEYFAPTPGNLGYLLFVLVQWCKEQPDGVFEVLV